MKELLKNINQFFLERKIKRIVKFIIKHKLQPKVTICGYLINSDDRPIVNFANNVIPLDVTVEGNFYVLNEMKNKKFQYKGNSKSVTVDGETFNDAICFIAK